MKTKGNITIIILFILTTIAITAAIFMPFNSRLRNLDFHVYDPNDNYHYEVKEKLKFSLNDTTLANDLSLTWHFGNGDTINNNKNFYYSYDKPGKYLITLDIDKSHSISKVIKVIVMKDKVAIDSIPRIHGVNKAYVGEEVVFFSNGHGINRWYWEFGETGTVDAYDEQAVHTYSRPGEYTVKLQTNTLKYPIYHKVVILKRFEKIEEVDNLEPLMLAQDDIKKRLQAIADAPVRDTRTFYNNVKYIKNKYICHNIKDIIVSINNSKYNDLYSYCQGLHYLEGDDNSIVIDKVELDTSKCFKKIEVTQFIRKQSR